MTDEMKIQHLRDCGWSEAADEIERLRADVETWRLMAREWKDEADRRADEIAKLREALRGREKVGENEGKGEKSLQDKGF